jgi:hypothetical protein
MTDEQEEFMEEVASEMEDRIFTKFPEGVKKYGTTLHKDHSINFLHEMAMEELTDLPTYLIAMKKMFEELARILSDSDCDNCKKALKVLEG